MWRCSRVREASHLLCSRYGRGCESRLRCSTAQRSSTSPGRGRSSRTGRARWQIGAEVFTVAASLDPITAAKGMRVLPDRTWADAGQIDVLDHAGRTGTRSLLAADEPLHDRLRAMAAAGTLMTSVCTGALVYAAAGLLRGRPATTHWENYADELAALDQTIEIRRDDRYVDDGDVITAAGVSAGIDMALHLVVRLDIADAARRVKREIQYTPATAGLTEPDCAVGANRRSTRRSGVHRRRCHAPGNGRDQPGTTSTCSICPARVPRTSRSTATGT